MQMHSFVKRVSYQAVRTASLRGYNGVC